MQLTFWNTRPTIPLYCGTFEVEFRGVASATIPLPDRDKLSDLLVVNEVHHHIEGKSADSYNPDRHYAHVTKIKVDRKHGDPKLRFFLR